MKIIDWENIDDKYAGFEKLAMQYVKDVFSSGKKYWKQTPPMGDGNRDAYTVIIGFHPENEPDEVWWMEAKYSEKKTYLSRFRLDATIVSSIFHDNIKKIIFVTNIDMRAKVISDIRTALLHAIRCDEVYFCTKNVMEYWLIQNPDIYFEYWKKPLILKENFSSLFVSEDIHIYPYTHIQNHFSEPLQYVYAGKSYYAYFKVISSKRKKVDFLPAIPEIQLKNLTSIDLDAGENTLSIPFYVKSTFSLEKKTENGKKVSLQFLYINTSGKSVPVLLKRKVSVLPAGQYLLSINTHENILFDMKERMTAFAKNKQPFIIGIRGKSGTGKSEILNRLLQEEGEEKGIVFFYCFTKDMKTNIQTPLNIIKFILFPYLSAGQIDAKYISGMTDRTITPVFQELVNKQKNVLRLEVAYKTTMKREGDIFPQSCILNERIILLDNVQNMGDTDIAFLFYLIREIKIKKIPVSFILSGQDSFFESNIYIKESAFCALTEYECVITENDIVNNLKNLVHDAFQISLENIHYFFPNLLIFSEFANFISILGEEIECQEHFIYVYNMFKQGELAENFILDHFHKIFSENQEVEKVCHLIYNSPCGYKPEKENAPIILHLLKSGLIKSDEYLNRLVPYHDLYERVFRQKYKLTNKKLNLPYNNELEKIQDAFWDRDDPAQMKSACKTITEYRKNGKFHTVDHILEPVFHSSYMSEYRTLLGTLDYYQLYFDYAYSAANCSRQYNGVDYFQIIYDEIKRSSDTDLRLLKLELLFELMNGMYNIRAFKQAMDYYREFQKIFSKLRRIGLISQIRSDSLMYVLCENMRILIQSERMKKKSYPAFINWRKNLLQWGYSHHYADFSFRFAQTLYTIDLHRAFEITVEAKECYDSNKLDSEKLLYRLEFQTLYLSIAEHRDFKYLSQLEHILMKMKKDFYSSYRHCNLAYCGLLYVAGDYDKAATFFFQDAVSYRKMRPKLRGFYYELLALNEALQGNMQAAQEVLEKALDIFSKLPDYCRPIRHNIKLLQRSGFFHRRIDLYHIGKLTENYYYIDPRMD